MAAEPLPPFAGKNRNKETQSIADTKPRQSRDEKPKPRKIRIAISTALCTILIAVSGIGIFFVHHSVILLSLVLALMWVGFIFGAEALRLEVLNHKETKVKARQCFWVMTGLTFLLCVGLFMEIGDEPPERGPSEQQVAAPETTVASVNSHSDSSENIDGLRRDISNLAFKVDRVDKLVEGKEQPHAFQATNDVALATANPIVAQVDSPVSSTPLEPVVIEKPEPFSIPKRYQDITTEQTAEFVRLHPEILGLVDAGARQIDVLIGKNHLAELMAIAKRPDFSRYLVMRDTNTHVVNSYNTIVGDFIQDVSDNADMSGYAIFPLPDLKNPL